MEMPVSNLTGLTLKDLLDAGLHFGHQTKRWNPKMKRYIFDKRNGIHIVDLTQTVTLIDEAAVFLRNTILKGKKILFVATKKQAQETVREAAESCGQFHMTERWLGGTLTNNQTIRRSVRRMRQIEAMGRNNNGVLSVHKKEASSLRRELDKLQRNLGGVADMDGKPGAMFVVDVCREQNAIKEACRLGIPLIALVDTNADPDPIEHVIPGNDDAVRGIKLIVDALAGVIKKANDEYSRIAAERQQQKEAEQAAKEAQERAARKARKEASAAKDTEDVKAKLSETRKRAAKVAKAAVEAKAAAVESAPAKAPAATLSKAPAASAAKAAEDAQAKVSETPKRAAKEAAKDVVDAAPSKAPGASAAKAAEDAQAKVSETPKRAAKAAKDVVEAAPEKASAAKPAATPEAAPAAAPTKAAAPATTTPVAG